MYEHRPTDKQIGVQRDDNYTSIEIKNQKGLLGFLFGGFS